MYVLPPRPVQPFAGDYARLLTLVYDAALAGRAEPARQGARVQAHVGRDRKRVQKPQL